MAQRPERKEPSYQIGIPLDARDDSALQPGDFHDHEETAHDYEAPPRTDHPSTEVSMPQDLAEEEPAPQSIPTTEVALPPQPQQQPRRQAPARSQTAVSGRSASSRSSRRTPAVSGRAPVSSRRAAAIDRGSLQKALLWVGIGVLLAVLAVAAVVLLVGRESPDRRLGAEALAEAGRQAEMARTAIVNRRGGEARKAYEQSLAALTKTPQLGGAIPLPPEEKPVVKDLALQASALRLEIEPLLARISAIEAENGAEANMAGLKARWATIGDAKTDLDQLERDIKAFIENPVDPKAGPNAAHAATFSRMVADANLRLPSIATERDRRRIARVVAPVKQADVEIDGLIQNERFGDALARLEVLAKDHPDADFNPLRSRTEDAAAKAWRSAKAQFDTRLADWKSPGATEGQRKTALNAAKERMNTVIQRFGMPQYVDQARSLLTPLP